MIKQGSDAWHILRAGLITGSRIKDVMSNGRGGKPSQKRISYKYELLAEIMTFEIKDQPKAKALDWGNTVEECAREAYEIKTGNIVTQVPFVEHPTIKLCGSSPDGLVRKDGGIEIKCPFTTEVHLKTIAEGVPEEHLHQIQCNMAVTGRQWWDFISYDPRVPAHLQLYVETVERDEEFIQTMEREIKIFEKEVLIMLKKMGAEDRLEELLERRNEVIAEHQQIAA